MLRCTAEQAKSDNVNRQETTSEGVPRPLGSETQPVVVSLLGLINGAHVDLSSIEKKKIQEVENDIAMVGKEEMEKK